MSLVVSALLAQHLADGDRDRGQRAGDFQRLEDPADDRYGGGGVANLLNGQILHEQRRALEQCLNQAVGQRRDEADDPAEVAEP